MMSASSVTQRNHKIKNHKIKNHINISFVFIFFYLCFCIYSTLSQRWKLTFPKATMGIFVVIFLKMRVLCILV